MTPVEKVAYTPREAGDASGMSEYQILAAIRSGELRTIHPVINGKPRRKYLILHTDLLAWLNPGRT